MTVKQGTRLALSITLTTFFVWLIVRQINFTDLKLTLFNAKKYFILAGVGSFIIGYSCRIKRWQLMLKLDNSNIRWHHCAGPLLSSFAINNVLPFRSGDVMRAFAFNKQLNLSAGIVTATLFIERLLDLLMLLLILGITLTLFNLDTHDFTGVGSATFILIALGILLLLLCPKLLAPIVVAFGQFFLRLSPKLGQKIILEIDKGLLTLNHLSKGGMMLKLLFWSMVAWLAEGFLFWFSALALSDITNPVASWLALPIGTLATLIPSTPGYVGTFDYFTIRAMTELSNTVSASTAYALLVHLLLWLPPTLTGGIYLLLSPTKIFNTSKSL